MVRYICFTNAQITMKRLRHPDSIPSMVYANTAGEIIDFPGLLMAGRSGRGFVRPESSDLIPLPEGSELFVLDRRHPVGFDPENGKPVTVVEDPFALGSPVRAVAAFMAPAHTAVLSSAYQKLSAETPVLPLFAYTAVGWHEGKFWVPAFRSDPDPRQDAGRFNTQIIKTKTHRQLRAFPENRLIQHLGKCCLTYGCPAARNYFLGRWEAPLPTSPSCNAACVGCISLQASGCCPSTQERIAFVPSPDEIAEMAVPHLLKAPRPVVSFGQGCEGEPLLQAAVLEAAIRKIRKRTSFGTINLNTNASMPDRVERLARAGLDSIRVSMNSARPAKYSLYYRPKQYSFDDVRESIHFMKRHRRFVSLNYFILPGFTDDPDEAAAFFDLVAECKPDLIQLRNLNMDPDWYLDTVKHRPSSAPIGITAWLSGLRKTFPKLRFGYFNPFLEKK